MAQKLDSYFFLIRDLVNLISKGDYKVILDNGQNGRVSIADLKKTIREYGYTIVPLPQEAFLLAECFIFEDEEQMEVILPLWTKEEGRSDLTLELLCSGKGDIYKVEIDDLHVL